MGDKDFIKPLLEQAGQVHFGKVRVQSLFTCQHLQKRTSHGLIDGQML